MKTYDDIMINHRIINNNYRYCSTPKHSRKGITADFEDLFGNAYRAFLRKTRWKTSCYIHKLYNNDTTVGIYSHLIINKPYSMNTLNEEIKEFCSKG